MERIIRVIGKGKLAVKPDTIRLIMTLEGIKEEYDETVKMSAEMTEIIKDTFESIGFSRESVRTLYFNIDAEYESYQDRDKNWKRRFEGYKFVHRIKIEFPSDNKLLGKVLYLIGHSPLHPEFSIEYTVANPEQSKNELLAKAVCDAKSKAEVLAKTADLKLGNIITIDYSWAEIEFISRPMNRMMLDECCITAPMTERDEGYNIDIDPDDIDVSDNVTVVWEIS